MQTRSDIYGNLPFDILNKMDDYTTLKRSQLEKLFDDDTKAIKTMDYLIKKKKLSSDGEYVSVLETPKPDKAVIAAVGVLMDVLAGGKIEYHTSGQLPAQVCFLTRGGDFYEIIYVKWGMETLISNGFRMNGDANIKRMMVVEDTRQIAELGNIPNVVRFACPKRQEEGFDYFNNKQQ